MQYTIQDIGTPHNRSQHGVKSDGLLDITALRATDRILSFSVHIKTGHMYDPAAAYDTVCLGS